MHDLKQTPFPAPQRRLPLTQQQMQGIPVSGLITSAYDRLTAALRVGDYVTVERMAEDLQPVLKSSPRLAIKLARARMAQGQMTAAAAILLQLANSSAAEVSLIAEVELDFIKAYRDADLRPAIDSSVARIDKANGLIDPLEFADATRAVARLVQMGRVYREVSDAEADAWRSRLHDALVLLRQAGRLDEYFDGYLNLADWPHQPLETRFEQLGVVAREARKLGYPARAAFAQLGRAAVMLDSGASASRIEAEIELARADFEAAKHVTGELEIRRARATLLIKDRAANPASLEKLAEEFMTARLPRQSLSVLIDLSQVAHERGQLVEAAAYRKRIDDLAGDLGLGFVRFGSELSIADIHIRNRRLADAMAVCRQGLERPAPRIVHANFRQLLATAFSFAGDRNNAEREGRLALSDYEEAGAEDIASIVVSKLADDIASPRTPEAIEHAVALLAPWVDKDLGRGDREAACVKLDTLGRFAFQRYAFAPIDRRDAGNLAHATEFLERARNIANTLSPRLAARQLGNIAQTIAQIEHARGSAGEPEASFEFAVRHYESAGLDMEAANSRYIIGVSQLNRAADAFRAGQGQAGIAHARESETKLSDALAYYDRAGMRAEAANARLMQAQLRLNFSVVATDPAVKAETRSEAVRLLEDAFADMRTMRVQYQLGNVRDDRVGKQHFAREAAATVQTALDVLLPFFDHSDAAWTWAQRAKSGALLELIMNQSHEPPAGLLASINRFPRLARLVSEELSLFGILVASPPEIREQFRSRISEIHRELEHDSVGREFVAFRAGTIFDETHADRLLVDGRGTTRQGVCVDYARTKSGHLYMLVQRPGEPTKSERLGIDYVHVEAIVDGRLGKNAFKTSLTRDANFMGEQLSALVEPLKRLTRPNELVLLSPVGALHAVPLHALPIDGEPLIVRNPVSYAWAFGITSLTIMRRNPPTTPSGVYVFGDPSGDRGHAKQLVVDLSKMIGGHLSVGDDVTDEALASALSHGRVVHFQGHAISRIDDPLASHLLAAADAKLTADRIMTMSSRADLVTLGACGTGAAVIAAGNEPSGLVPSLLIAGARSVLATLWPVSDHSAAHFMRNFYHSLIADGMPKADALRSAMLSTRQHPGFEAPYHWAPYVIHGDWL